jgi:hypothetical protein
MRLVPAPLQHVGEPPLAGEQIRDQPQDIRNKTVGPVSADLRFRVASSSTRGR